MKERIDIPAPIPEHGAIAVPAGVPVPEGFTYYLRADLGWSFAGDRSFSESGRTYGIEPSPFTAIGGTGFVFGDAFFGPSGLDSDDVLTGTIGFGAYFTRHLRGDLTLDFRGKQGITNTSAYAYDSTTGEAVTGTVSDRINLRSVVGLANLYWDLLPRGAFTPYVGAGVGFVYYDAQRSYTDDVTADAPGPGGITTDQITGSGGARKVALAGALMAGASFAVSHAWMLDVNYRALYLGGFDVIAAPINTTVPSSTKATLGDTWEHQVRVGLRFNIW
jgi:opacity protein-like surface antigen